MLGSSHTPFPGAYWVTHAPTPTPSAPTWAPTLSGILKHSTSSGVQGAYSMPSTDGPDLSDVVTGTISVDSFDAYVRTMCGSRTGGWSLPCVMSD
jgi:hypothetical protein